MFCKAFNNAIRIDPTGIVLPCCRFNFGDKTPRRYVTEFSSIDDIIRYNNTLDSKKTHSTTCIKCFNEEKYGTSYRHKLAKIIQNTPDYTVKFLEIAVDNTCNLYCIMCNPDFSSKWASKQKNINLSLPDFSNLKKSTNPEHILSVVENSNLSQLTVLKILGGEPFYSKHTKKILETIDRKTDLSKIELHVYTNCTVYPEYINILKKFKRCRIYLSIDAVGKVSEYARPGVSWKIIYNTFKQWIKTDFDIVIKPTITLSTLEHIPTLINFITANKVWSSAFDVAYNSHVSILNLDVDTRKEIINNSDHFLLKNVLNLEEVSNKNMSHILEYINDYDSINAHKFKDISPKVYNKILEMNNE